MLAYRAKYWMVFPTLVLGASVEVIGWAGRLWSNRNVLYITPFLMQITTLIMAPVFFSAYDYIILGMAIDRLGPQYSVLRPRNYFILFILADIVSLILQAVGGGQAAASAADSAPTQSATDIMVAGIIFQLVSMAVFVVLGFDFILRASKDRPYAFREKHMSAKKAQSSEALSPAISEGLSEPEKDISTENSRAPDGLKPWWLMLAGCLVSSIAIVVRGVFRSVELSQGWTGTIMQTEIYQCLLDALMMVLAAGVFLPLNPLFLLPRRRSWRSSRSHV